MKELEAVKGLSEAKILKMRDAAREVVPGWQAGSSKFSIASEIVRQREGQIVRVSTGSTAFDAMLGGGIETKALTEIHGESNQGNASGNAGSSQRCASQALWRSMRRARSGSIRRRCSQGNGRKVS